MDTYSEEQLWNTLNYNGIANVIIVLGVINLKIRILLAHEIVVHIDLL